MGSPHDLDLSSELRLVPALADVGKEALAELAVAATQRRAHAGTVLVEQAAVSPGLVVLLRGAAKTVRTVASGGGESSVVLDVMRAPCVVMESSILDAQPATASVVTLRSSHVAVIDRRQLPRLFATYPAFTRAILVRAGQEMRSRARRIDQIAVGPVDERVKQLLDSLAFEHGTPLGQGRFIAIPLRRRDLANMVNATTETVSRLLAKFERDGLARSTRDGIWWRSTAPSTKPSKRASEPPSDAAHAPAASGERSSG